MDDKQKQLDEDIEILRQLLEETSRKYNCYVSMFCSGDYPACVNGKPKVNDNGPRTKE